MLKLEFVNVFTIIDTIIFAKLKMKIPMKMRKVTIENVENIFIA